MPKDKTKFQSLPETDPQWYKDAVIYQLHVKSFYDSSGDGIGDFKGLTQKLDYLQDLGITTIWLLPFYPSPQKDDGYDISDYKNIHPAYGTLRDFREFLKKAHNRGIRVITELVVNHTSDQHPWFQRARQSPAGSKYRNWYVWSDTPHRYSETRIIFQDFESSNWTWDPVAKAYYWHRFYSHQPDLNYDNPQVQKAILNVLDFWMNQGVDGLRMDAVPYLFERENTNCENLPETHDFLKKIRAHMDEKFTDRMMLAEANQWPEDAAAYFGDGDEFHMAFHFPLMPRLYMALQMEDSFPIVDIMEQTPDIPASSQWAIFLRNHDELTLEMVTDEERDYMYRVYARDPKMRLNLGIRRRLAPLMNNHRRRIELMNALLFSMPGTPIIYYGDEIAMGDNIYLGDRDGVRTPMQWSGDRNAGFSKVNPQALFLPVNISPEYHFEVINAEVQQENIHSVLWWMKRIIKIRKRFKAFSRGTIEFLRPENHHILSFIRSHEQEPLLVVINLSRFAQYVELDLSAHQNCIPIELFGGTSFPPITDDNYFLSLGPHSFYWFYLSEPDVASEKSPSISGSELPEIILTGKSNNVFEIRNKSGLERILSTYIQNTRWFGSKGRLVKQATLKQVIPLEKSEIPKCFLFVQMDYMQGDPETYVLPVTYTTDIRESDPILAQNSWAAIAWVKHKPKDTVYLLHDGLADREFCMLLLKMFERRQRIKVGKSLLNAVKTSGFTEIKKQLAPDAGTTVIRSEQSNTSVTYDTHFILKLIRRLSPGVNPDLEIGKFLTRNNFSHSPRLVGAMEFFPDKSNPFTLSILHEFVANQGDAWTYTQDHLAVFFENALAGRDRFEKFLSCDIPSLDQIPESMPEEMFPPESFPPEPLELIGSFLESVRMIGVRTAQLHLTLASAPPGTAFAPEPFTTLYQRSLYQSFRAFAIKTFHLLNRNIDTLPEDAHEDAIRVKTMESVIFKRFKVLLTKKISAKRIRCHGDYHLGQILYTGKDFKIIDFEGEPARPISERTIKRSALRDVAGMLRSFHYAAYSAFLSLRNRGVTDAADDAYLEACALRWYEWVRILFLQSYLPEARTGGFLPEDMEDITVLLDSFLLDKAIYELAYELNNRPGWVKIPLKGLLELTGKEPVTST